MKIRKFLKRMPVLSKYSAAKQVYPAYSKLSEIPFPAFLMSSFLKLKLIRTESNRTGQICNLISSVKNMPTDNDSFYYSIDVFKRLETDNRVFDNFAIDYSWVVNASFAEIERMLDKIQEDASGKKNIISALRSYTDRMKADPALVERYSDNIEEIRLLFVRKAAHFHEALQRILFVNQWLWQTGHILNGFGRLDMILYDVYRRDMDEGYITRELAGEYLKDFFVVLHDKYWYKSSMLMGDTGQNIVLGGVDMNGMYQGNDLTALFIETARELRLPDPKIQLRISDSMPDELLKLALECIGTGIGAPMLSNDDIIIPALIGFGYEEGDAYRYAASACAEPLIIGKTCDQNNMETMNICIPLLEFAGSDIFTDCCGYEDVLRGYFRYLSAYIDRFITKYDDLDFEDDPLLTLFNPEILKTGKDIVHGGAKYANIGLTSVGLSTVVNSLLNLKRYVFEEKRFTLKELNDIRKSNFEDHDDVAELLSRWNTGFGNDEEGVIHLTNSILLHISEQLEKHTTGLGGKYKYGLSSPNYIIDADRTEATFDGRKAGEPFGVHISGRNGLAPTELMRFAGKLDYGGNRINGNVTDIILSPDLFRRHLTKVMALIRGAVREGVYQIQINVVDSTTLIQARNNPELFPDLIVRVWGFSAYFKDLPQEYQDNLIRRTLDAEKNSYH